IPSTETLFRDSAALVKALSEHFKTHKTPVLVEYLRSAESLPQFDCIAGIKPPHGDKQGIIWIVPEGNPEKELTPLGYGYLESCLPFKVRVRFPQRKAAQ